MFGNSILNTAYESWLVVEKNIDKYISEYLDKEQKENREEFIEMFKFISFCYQYSRLLPGYSEDFAYLIEMFPKYLFYIYNREANYRRTGLIKEIICLIPEIGDFFLSKKLDVYVDRFFDFRLFDIDYKLSFSQDLDSLNDIKSSEFYGYIEFKILENHPDFEENKLKEIRKLKLPRQELKRLRKSIRKPNMFPEVFIKYFKIIDEYCSQNERL